MPISTNPTSTTYPSSNSVEPAPSPNTMAAPDTTPTTGDSVSVDSYSAETSAYDVATATNPPNATDHSGPTYANPMSLMIVNRIGAIDSINDTSFIDGNFNTQLSELPLEGAAEREPWSGSYWPKSQGGMSYRWQTGEAHTYQSPTLDQVKEMSLEELNKLSPTEKYDLFVGSYEYPLTESMKSSNSANAPSWQGYCHGWSPASIHFKEPKPVVMEGAGGIRIPFTSSDIKGLLTYFQGDVVTTLYGRDSHPFKEDVFSVGANNNAGKAAHPNSWDLNPGSFHILLANYIGNGEAFSIDCDNGPEKWNQPVHRFDSEILGRRPPDARASEKAIEEVIIRSSVTYTIEIEQNAEANTDSGLQSNRTEEYMYTVELDENGEIVGGQWLTDIGGNAWTYHEVKEFLENNGHGEDEINGTLRQLFRFPDYAYVQEKGQFADTFKPAPSKYAFIGNDKKLIHGYLAKLGEVYDAATAIQ
jgi:hypothetical protein